MMKREARIASTQVKQAASDLGSVLVAAQEPEKALVSHLQVTAILDYQIGARLLRTCTTAPHAPLDWMMRPCCAEPVSMSRRCCIKPAPFQNTLPSWKNAL
jgi:hypothetical protein